MNGSLEVRCIEHWSTVIVLDGQIRHGFPGWYHGLCASGRSEVRRTREVGRESALHELLLADGGET